MSDRLKTVYFDRNAIVDMLNAFNGYECLRLPVMPEIPADARVEEMFYDNSRRCWGAHISHPSFDRVLPGCLVPIAELPDDSFLSRGLFRREPLPYADEPEQRTLAEAQRRLSAGFTPEEFQNRIAHDALFRAAISLWISGDATWEMTVANSIRVLMDTRDSLQKALVTGSFCKPLVLKIDEAQLKNTPTPPNPVKAAFDDWRGVPWEPEEAEIAGIEPLPETSRPEPWTPADIAAYTSRSGRLAELDPRKETGPRLPHDLDTAAYAASVIQKCAKSLGIPVGLLEHGQEEATSTKPAPLHRRLPDGTYDPPIGFVECGEKIALDDDGNVIKRDKSGVVGQIPVADILDRSEGDRMAEFFGSRTKL